MNTESEITQKQLVLTNDLNACVLGNAESGEILVVPLWHPGPALTPDVQRQAMAGGLRYAGVLSFNTRDRKAHAAPEPDLDSKTLCVTAINRFVALIADELAIRALKTEDAWLKKPWAVSDRHVN